MGKKTDKGFTEFRYIRCKTIQFARSLTFYFDVNQETNKIDFSWASCSENDNFSREIGRNTSTKNFNTIRNLSCNYNRDLSLVENAINRIKSFSENRNETNGALFDEIVRAVSIYDEVESLIKIEDYINNMSC